VIVGLDEEMHVVRLNRNVAYAKRSIPEAARKCAADCLVRATLAQARQAMLYAHHDVHGVIRAKFLSWSMRRIVFLTWQLVAASVLARATPGAHAKIDFELRIRHLEKGRYHFGLIATGKAWLVRKEEADELLKHE
jgi:hypothetical protein